MAVIAHGRRRRRQHVRNFAPRRELLEALMVDEVYEPAAATVESDCPGDRLESWLRRFFRYVSTTRCRLGLLKHADTTDPVFNTRGPILAAGQPILYAALAGLHRN